MECNQIDSVFMYTIAQSKIHKGLSKGLGDQMSALHRRIMLHGRQIRLSKMSLHLNLQMGCHLLDTNGIVDMLELGLSHYGKWLEVNREIIIRSIFCLLRIADPTIQSCRWFLKGTISSTITPTSLYFVKFPHLIEGSSVLQQEFDRCSLKQEKIPFQQLLANLIDCVNFPCQLHIQQNYEIIDIQISPATHNTTKYCGRMLKPSFKSATMRNQRQSMKSYYRIVRVDRDEADVLPSNARIYSLSLCRYKHGQSSIALEVYFYDAWGSTTSYGEAYRPTDAGPTRCRSVSQAQDIDSTTVPAQSLFSALYPLYLYFAGA